MIEHNTRRKHKNGVDGIKQIFLCGDSGAGKTFLITRIIAEYGLKCCGFFSKKEPRDSDRIERVYLHAAEGERYYNSVNCIAESPPDSIEKKAHIEVFESLGVSLMSSIPEHELVIMDELGFLESKAPEFCKRVLDVLRSGHPVLGVIKNRHTDFLDQVREFENVAVIYMDIHDREHCYNKVATIIEDALNKGQIKKMACNQTRPGYDTK